jgi:hypothetical protein
MEKKISHVAPELQRSFVESLVDVMMMASKIVIEFVAKEGLGREDKKDD